MLFASTRTKRRDNFGVWESSNLSLQDEMVTTEEMKFLAIESLRISLKLNISAARERQAVGLGLFNVVASWVMAC